MDLNLEVAVPTAAGTETAEFSAYAFNEDRVKSATATRTWTRPEAPAAPRRAFVIAIGIDAYDDPALRLNFAANDGQAMLARLRTIPGYAVHPIDLTAARGGAPGTRRVTRELLEIVLSTLAGGDPGVARAYLADAGFDGAALDVARPDDLVIVTYSGHGHTDAQGNFFLVPSDAAIDPTTGEPAAAGLLSAANLAVYLGAVNAGEIALVIDACRSAASVAAHGFKPGPMGDPGLGQVAFDKGIRILAASQADDVALESDRLRQGLLTYALAREGLGSGAPADLDHDGRITLDEWLRYGERRLPALSADIAAGCMPTAARGVVLLGETRTPAAILQPALFDFTGSASPVTLAAAP